jgi:hypothetical protein
VPRLLRYLLVWLACTAVAVTAVFVTVRFVVHSTTPLPPTARALPSSFGSAAATPRATAPAPPSPQPAVTGPSPRPSHPAHRVPSHTPAPRHSTAPPVPARPAATQDPAGCQGGAGTHTVQARGGQVTIRWGVSAVCLVSAVPAQGFTTRTGQPSADTLAVTFSAAHHRSQITASLHPQPKEVTTESSW